MPNYLPELIKQLAFLQAGGEEETALDKLNKTFGTISSGAKNIADMKATQAKIAESVIARKKAQLEADELTRRNTPRFPVEVEKPPEELEQEVKDYTGKLGSFLMEEEERRAAREKLQAQAPRTAAVGPVTEAGEGAYAVKTIDPERFRELGIEERKGQAPIPPSLTKKIVLTTDEYKDYTDAQANLLLKAKGENKLSFADVNAVRREAIGRREVEDYQTIKGSVMALEGLVNAMDKDPRGSQLGVQQAAITLFNRILDPRSTVREAEYLRTPEGLALVDRLTGKLVRITRGGAGLNPQAVRDLLKDAKVVLSAYGDHYNKVLDSYNSLAQMSNVDPRYFTGTLPRHTSSSYVESNSNSSTSELDQLISIMSPEERAEVDKARKLGTSDAEIVRILKTPKQ